jgi:hypothetical protein
MLDDLAELGTASPWIYRGWVYLFSAQYRRDQNRRWRVSGLVVAALDILTTLGFFTVEVVFVWWVGRSMLSL